MAEKKPKKEKEEKGQEQEKESNVHSFGGRKDKKSTWTVERCQKASKRFDSVEAWSKGHPSSYKSAVAHGWVAECSTHMQPSRSYQRTA